MTNNEITLCLIARNEEEHLAACIESARAVADRIIVIDTGSTDATSEIARLYTPEVIHFRFGGNYAAARNVALDSVSTEWTLFLDADERLDQREAEKLRASVDSAESSVHGFTLLRFHLFGTGGFASDRPLRLFRARPHIRYRNSIAESVSASITENGGTIVPAPSFFNHLGHCRPRAVREQKSRRYMEMIKTRLREEGDNPILCAHLALILRKFGNFDESMAWSDRSIRIEPISSLVWLLRGHVLRGAGRDEEALRAFCEAQELDATDACVWNMVGVMKFTLGRLEEAEEAFERGRRIDDAACHILINQGLVRQALGCYGEAARLLSEAAHRNSAFLIDDWRARLELDPYRSLSYETIFHYAGLPYHLSYCRQRASLGEI